MRHHASVHFTIKDQDLSVVKQKLNEWLADSTSEVDFAGKIHPFEIPITIMHSCFMSRQAVEQKGFKTDLVDYLDEIAPEQINWYAGADNLEMSRTQMLTNLKRNNGVALFVGVVRDGVMEEYAMAQKLGVDIIEIP